jgi:hypothetical protein
MGFFKSLFGSGEREAPPVEAVETGSAIEEETAPPAAEIFLSEDEKAALSGLAGYEDGTSLEVFGETAGLESMAALYRLDKLVRLGLVKRSRPLFMEPEVYELTDRGREML